nr:hypothetical protein [Tanacetum cinerariifolium]
MGDEHLSTIPEMESDEVINYSVENRVSIPNEFEDCFDNENVCDVPVNDESSPIFLTFSNPLYDSDDDFTSGDDEPLSNEDDSDSQIEKIDLFLATDDLMPPGIEYDDYDSEGDIHFLNDLLRNDPLPLTENESSNFDHHDDLFFPRPALEPPYVEVFFDFEPDTGVLTTKVVKDISEHYVLMPKVLPTQHALYPNIDTLLPFSSRNEDKVFKPDGTFPSWMSRISISILVDQAQVWGIESSSILDLEDSRARGFVHRPLKLQSFTYGNLIS